MVKKDREKTKQKIISSELLMPYADKSIDALTKIIIDRWIPELEQNLTEWIENKPFSDIEIGNEWTLTALTSRRK